ncbi:hypothetical protein KJ671_03760 [Patescibacteria group bacterium]|nr:hypothetical protein [Patescibacteria group bacterium]
MMDLFIKLFDSFNLTAKSLAGLIPNSKEELLEILKQIWGLVISLNRWISNTLGVDIQRIINIITSVIVKYSTIAFDFIIELLKRLSERV